MDTVTTIECLCGEVKMALQGEPLFSFYCHCDDCQAVHGAAYIPGALYRYQQTRIVAGEPVIFRRRITARGTCRVCGTRMFAEPPGEQIRTIIGTLLPPDTFHPTFHIQCQHARLPVRDGLPHYKAFPARFGGSDDVVAW
jgi:hypothetical protein